MKETDIQKAICDYLVLKGHFFTRLNNIPVYDKGRGIYRAMPKYSMKGLFDILVVRDDGIAMFLEVKTEKGKLSQHQKDFMRKCPGFCFVVRSIKDVQEIGL